MSAAISVQNISKRYRIRTTDRTAAYRTLREDLMRFAGNSLRLLSRNSLSQREDFWALKGVSFDIEPSEVVGIIGRNGAGKSTLLKILSRITKPTAGCVRLRGRVASLLEVGTGFHPELTGRENIFLSGAILGMKPIEIRRRFDEIVAFAEIDQFLDTAVKHYSSGMYVRLAFSVAAHLEPDVVIIDEVLAVGDAAFQKKCLNNLQSAAQVGRTILFVSHNLAAVNQLCRQALWIDQGVLRASGLAAEITSAYLSSHDRIRPERTWTYPGDAPGDERVRLLGVRVEQGNQVATVADINRPLRVVLKFVLLRDVKNLISGISLYQADSTCLFANVDWRPNELRAGTYEKTVEVPAPLLPEGQLNLLVQLVFFEPSVTSVVVPDAITFDAVDSDHIDSVRGHYKGAWPGAVRIQLPWSDAARLSV